MKEETEGLSSGVDMVEKVEAAIRAHITCDAAGLAPAVASIYLDGFREAARAAVEAMREPTERMTNAAGDGPNTSSRIYRAMIDAALSTG